MKIYCKNTLSGLIPMYNSDHEEKKKLKLGVEYRCEISQPRNLGFHKKFFALLNVGHMNTRMGGISFEGYRSYVTMKAGYYDTYETPKGHVFLPKSISFASMGQRDFERLYSAVIDVIIQDIGVSKEELIKEIINFI